MIDSSMFSKIIILMNQKMSDRLRSMLEKAEDQMDDVEQQVADEAKK